MICVRSNRKVPYKLTVNSHFSPMGTNSFPPMRTKNSNPGTAGGITAALTNHFGMGTFDNFTLDTSGLHNLTFSSPGLESTTFQIEARDGLTSDQNICAKENDRFITQNGGCHDTTNNIVFGSLSGATYTWGQVVWDSTLAGNNVPDADDGENTQDYEGNSGRDDSLVDYCHDLTEGGHTDWRPVTLVEAINTSAGGVLYNFLKQDFRDRLLWTATDMNSTQAYTYQITSNGASTNCGSNLCHKNVPRNTFCVRTP